MWNSEKFRRAIEYFVSLPKSLYVCVRLLPFKQAIRLPIWVRYNVKLLDTAGCVKISDRRGVKTGMCRIGFGDVGVFDKTYERGIIELAGEMELKGKAFFGHGSRINVMKNGRLIIGDDFVNSAMITIICDNYIQIGDRFRASWNVLIMDTDFHYVRNLETGKVGVKTKPIIIGNRIWIGLRSVVLKGSELADGCIVGANSVINKKYITPSTLIAGNPASERKHNVERAYDMDL